jgi:nucleoside-diphosphate-sugar epimerase
MQEIDYLITGASGFFGTIIAETLSPDCKLHTLGRSNMADYVGDLSKDVPILSQDLVIHSVVHAAGKAHVIPKNEHQANEFFQVNFQGTVNLTRALEKLDRLPASFVFISTVAVYGKEEGNLIDEDHPLMGDTPYAKSKIESEKFLMNWCALHKVQLTILRLPLLVGVNPPGNLGAIIRWMKRGLYVGIGEGSAKRSMVLAEDVAKFIPVVSKIGGTYNLTDGYNPSLAEVEHSISRQIKKSAPIRLPNQFVRIIAGVGDVLGGWFPLNSVRYKKLTSSLTFSDARARQLGWSPRSVILNLRIL